MSQVVGNACSYNLMPDPTSGLKATSVSMKVLAAKIVSLLFRAKQLTADSRHLTAYSRHLITDNQLIESSVLFKNTCNAEEVKAKVMK